MGPAATSITREALTVSERGARTKLTKAMAHFLRAHLYDKSSHGYLSRWDATRAGHKSYLLASRARTAGLVTINDAGGELRFPYLWAGTTITDAGRAAVGDRTAPTTTAAEA